MQIGQLLTGFGGGIIKQLGVRIIWNKQKWKLVFHIVDAQGPILLGLKTLRHIGIFTKHPRVYIETIGIHSTNPGLASQLKEGENDQTKSKYCNIALDAPKVGVAAFPSSARELVSPAQVSRDNVHANIHLDLLSERLNEPQYDIEDDWKQVDEYMDMDNVETS